MDTRSLRRTAVTLLAALAMLLGAASLLLLTRSAQSPEDFDRLSSVTLALNVVGLALLVTLLAGNLIRLIRDLRDRVPGARLKSRMVATLIGLAILPLLLVYYFSVQFLNRGIDSWFDVRIESGLVEALELSRSVLDLQMRDNLDATESMALDLFGIPDRALVRELASRRLDTGASELTVFSNTRRILATSTGGGFARVPAPIENEVLLQTRAGNAYVYFDPLKFEVRTAARISSSQTGLADRILRASFPVPERVAQRAAVVDATYTNYKQLEYLREPLKRSLMLTLTVVLLVSLLAAIYGAFFFSRRLAAPIQQLVAGTRAVAAGDFDTRLPMPSRDEIGFLVNSFNDMTRRLAIARETARRSQALVESERHYLEIILARLSTGVISLESDLELRTANQSASAILGIELGQHVGRRLNDIANGQHLAEQFAAVVQIHTGSGDKEWREQIVLSTDSGSRVVTCACSALQTDGEADGFVIVFEDITGLVQAQRDAAWGEVARRLAHEIKNPLTPIQLSAERLRRKYLGKLPPGDVDVLDRATYTIVQQVEAMKSMVNAFSEYARSPDLSLVPVELNEIVGELAELYRPREADLTIVVDPDPAMPTVQADAGRLRQILHNLIRNAIEAIDAAAGGKIIIETRHRIESGGHFATLRVRDNGPGFKDGDTENVFDPYVTTKAKGTGLGLAIVKKLVEEHSGVISARNLTEGGAEIEIEFPVDDAARETLAARSPIRSNRPVALRRAKA
ncbi:MAG: ATP-binding protein [Pseudomonadota bacterium]